MCGMDHYRTAITELSKVDQAERALAEAYAGGRTSPALVAELHQDIGRGFKRAEVHATLAVAVELADLNLRK